MASKTRDFTEGPLFFRIILFALPIMLTGILQLLYNMADQVVVGQFSGDPNALSAVGSTSSLNHLIVNLALGLSTGAGVLVAQHFGAHNDERVTRTVHTAFSIALITGVLLGAVGFFAARPILVLMGTNGQILDLATLYIRIIFAGIPATALYNFGASVLRSVGDSRTPLIILAATGLVNVGLNLFFVIVCEMSVDGVAYATTIAQYLSALCVWLVLARRSDATRFRARAACIDRRALRDILRIGVPSGIQGSLFSLSNMLLQSGVNALSLEQGLELVSGNTVGGTIEGFTYTAMNSFYQATLTFTGQNVGAGKPDRVRRTLLYSALQVAVIGAAIGYGCILFSDALTALFVDTSLPEAPAIMAAAKERTSVILSTYFLCGLMEVLTGHLRGRGYSLIPMFSSLLGTVVFRAGWVLAVFPSDAFHSLGGLFLCYPLSWVLVCLLHLATALYAARRDKKQGNTQKNPI